MKATPFSPSPAFAEATEYPDNYRSTIVVGYIFAIIVGIIGLVIGIVGGFCFVKPLIARTNADKFDEDDLSDIFDE
jgi:hypothetical protein